MSGPDPAINESVSDARLQTSVQGGPATPAGLLCHLSDYDLSDAIGLLLAPQQGRRWKDMIPYHTYSEIRFLREGKGMSCEGIACHLHLDARTVSKWARREAYVPRKASPRTSILDPYKPAIRRDWELGESSGTAIFKGLRRAGYARGCSIPGSYLHSGSSLARSRKEKLKRRADHDSRLHPLRKTRPGQVHRRT